MPGYFTPVIRISPAIYHIPSRPRGSGLHPDQVVSLGKFADLLPLNRLPEPCPLPDSPPESGRPLLCKRWYDACALACGSTPRKEDSAMSQTVKYHGSRSKSPPCRTIRRTPRIRREVKYRGLCSTCVNAPGCTFPRSPGKAVFHCEEFDGGAPLPTKTVRKAGPRQTASATNKDKHSARFIGLCSNCENRKTCVFPKPEGGVWHCEEYA